MIILDTNIIVAFYNTRDENHEKAVKLMKDITEGKYGNLYITDYIFDEIITVIFIRLKDLSKVIEIGEAIRKSVEILSVGKIIFDGAWELFISQRKTWFSFTDCATLSAMHRRNIKNIATFDKDFKEIKGIDIVQ